MGFHLKSEDSDMTEENASTKMNKAKQEESEATGTTEEPEDPRKLLTKASETDNYEDKLRLYDKALARDALDFDAWIEKGFALDRSGKSKEALACYDKALEIDPEKVGIKWLKRFAFNNLKEIEKSIE